jgi:hypothetical protein
MRGSNSFRKNFLIKVWRVGWKRARHEVERWGRKQ